MVVVLGMVTTSKAQWYRPTVAEDTRQTNVMKSSIGRFTYSPEHGTQVWDTITRKWQFFSPHELIYLRDSTMLFSDTSGSWHVSHDAGMTLMSIRHVDPNMNRSPVLVVGDTIVAVGTGINRSILMTTHDLGVSGWWTFGEKRITMSTYDELIWLDSVVVVVHRSRQGAALSTSFHRLNGTNGQIPLDTLITNVHLTSNRPIIWYGGRPSLRRLSSSLDGLTSQEFPGGAVTDFGDMLFLVSQSSEFYTSHDDGYTWVRRPDFHISQQQHTGVIMQTHDDSIRVTAVGNKDPLFVSDSTLTSWTMNMSAAVAINVFWQSTLGFSAQGALLVWRSDNQAYSLSLQSSQTKPQVLFHSGPVPHSTATTPRGTIIKFFSNSIHRSTNDGIRWDSISSSDVILQGGCSNGLLWKLTTHLFTSDDEGLTWNSVLPDLTVPSADSLYVSAGYAFIARHDGLHILQPDGKLVVTKMYRDMHIRSSMIHNGSIYMIIDSSVYVLRDSLWLMTSSIPKLIDLRQVVAHKNYFYGVSKDAYPIRWSIDEPATILSNVDRFLLSLSNTKVGVVNDVITFRSPSIGLRLYIPSPTTTTPWIRFDEPFRQRLRFVAQDDVVTVQMDNDILLPDGSATIYSTLGNAYRVTVFHGQFPVHHLPRGVYTLPVQSFDQQLSITVLVL